MMSEYSMRGVLPKWIAEDAFEMCTGEDALISIVMPAYNASKTIAAAMDSVLIQTYPHWELIVIDDGSQDGTKSIAEQYAARDARVRILTNEVNRGVSFSRKRGVESARGQWIAFLDSDDMWKENKLEKQLAAQRRTNAKLLFTASAYVNSEGVPIDWILHVPETISYRGLLKQNLISNSSVLVLKQVYQSCSVSGDDLHEDYACWLNFLKQGETAFGMDEPLLVYRLNKNSKSGNKIRSARMNWKTYRAIGLNLPETVYYMAWYTVRGIKKYRHLRA